MKDRYSGLFISGFILILFLTFSCSGVKTNSAGENDESAVVKSNLGSDTNLGEITSPYFEMVREVIDGHMAYETTAFVEKYWRVVGNTGFNESVYWIARQLEDAGFILEEKTNLDARFTYRIEKRDLEDPTWEPVSAEVTIVENDSKLLDYNTNRNMILLNSASTPSEGLTAEVLHISNRSELKKMDLKGKIIFAEMPPSDLYRSEVFEKGAIGIMTYDNPDYLQPEKNKTSIQFRRLPKEYSDKWGIALSFEAKEKIKQKLKDGTVNLRVKIATQSYKSEELTVIANIKGRTLPHESLVFSAHIQEPGANDNATGVGTQLEMAIATYKLIKQEKLDLERTLTFLWGDEIVSTRRYINEKTAQRPEIKWGISLDMVGENTSITGGSFLIEKMPDPSAIYTRGEDIHTEWGGKKLEEEDMKPHYLNDLILSVFKDQGKYANWEVNTNPFEGGSDHTPFLDADIPGLLLWHFTDQFYHTDKDRLDKVSVKTMKNVGTGALVSAYTLLNADRECASLIAGALLHQAKNRLDTEFLLSKIEINHGKPLEEEIRIIKSWTNWYKKALDSVRGLDIDAEDLNFYETQLAEYSSLMIKRMERL